MSVPSSTVASSTFTNGALPFSEGSLVTFWGSLSGPFLSGSTLTSLLTGRMLPGDRGRTWAGAALTKPEGKEGVGLGVPGKWGKDLDGSLEHKQRKEKGTCQNKLARIFFPRVPYHVIIPVQLYGKERKIFSFVYLPFMWQRQTYSL